MVMSFGGTRLGDVDRKPTKIYWWVLGRVRAHSAYVHIPLPLLYPSLISHIDGEGEGGRYMYGRTRRNIHTFSPRNAHIWRLIRTHHCPDSALEI